MSISFEALLDDFRAYAAPFSKHSPVITTRFQGGADPLFPFSIESDRGLGILLLGAALYRPGGETKAGEILAELYARFGNDIFRLNRVPFEDIHAILDNPDGEEQKRIPAILRSVCDFFYQTGSLNRWLESTEDWETGVRQLSENIYWMGRHSQSRTKSRYFFWLISFQPQFQSRFPQAAHFDWPVVEGHLRFYHNILSPKSKQALANAAKRLHVFSQLAGEAFPMEPWVSFQPFDAYLRPEKEHEYLCRKIQGGCTPCPLKKKCPAAKYFPK